MINRLLRALAASLFFIGTGNVVVQADSDPGAAGVAQAYFEALRSGNRQALLSLFAGSERQRSEAQLNDPAYSQFLIARYSNARLEITASGEQGGIPFVDIAIWLNAVESVKERLVLRATGNSTGLRYVIAARKELAD
ncbi:MAG: hypothetical protein ACM3NI_09985 [Bacteroidota bacterium]